MEASPNSPGRRTSECSLSMRRLLMVAYHFPPQAGSSGHLRSLKYCRYLPESGWRPTVLTVSPRAYAQTDRSQMHEIPPEIKVVRAFALDTQKHLSLRGCYLRYLALPDRWVTWCLGAVPAGLWEIYRGNCEAIFTTFPVPTAVLIGLILNRITRRPWVVDFRDSMTEDEYPRDLLTRKVLRWIEGKAVKYASQLIFTAPSAVRMYKQRYPNLAPEKCLLISNGYDEEDFRDLAVAKTDNDNLRVRLLHSGLIYPYERNPIPFFHAIAALKRQNQVQSSWLSIDLRASGSEEQYRSVVEELEIDDIVHFLPSLPYRQALEDANSADALLLLQAANCDHQIPAKAYEYLRFGKPILALTSHSGDTAALMTECGGTTIADIADEHAIEGALRQFLNSVRTATHPLPQSVVVAKHSRREQSRVLAECLARVARPQDQVTLTSAAKQAGMS